MNVGITISRRAALTISAAAGAASLTGTLRAARAQSGPIQIGAAFPLSGSQAQNGASFTTGVKIAVAQINRAGGINGRQIELVLRDDKATPTDAQAAVRDLLSKDIKLIIGGEFTTTTLSPLPAIAEGGGVFITTGATTPAISHELYQRSNFRIYPNSHMIYRAQAQIMAQKYPAVRNWGVVMPDLEYAHSNWNAFKSGLAEYYPKYAHATPQIAEPLLTKFGASDFKVQISELMASPVEGIYSALAGADVTTFFTQARAFGLDRKLKVINDVGLDLLFAKSLGRNTPDNVWSSTVWYYDAPNRGAASRALYDDYVAMTKDQYPIGVVWAGHAAMQALATGIRTAGSTDSNAVITAMENVTFETATGPVRFRKEDHMAMPKIGFIKMAAQEAEPGWKVTDYTEIDGADVIEPAAPGVKYVEL